MIDHSTIDIRHSECLSPWAGVDAWRKELHRDFECVPVETKLPERPDYEASNWFLIKAWREMANREGTRIAALADVRGPGKAFPNNPNLIEDTYEEIIFHLLERKQGLFNEVIDTMSAQREPSGNLAFAVHVLPHQGRARRDQA